jgi:hypothetical protein
MALCEVRTAQSPVMIKTAHRHRDCLFNIAHFLKSQTGERPIGSGKLEQSARCPRGRFCYASRDARRALRYPRNGGLGHAPNCGRFPQWPQTEAAYAIIRRYARLATSCFERGYAKTRQSVDGHSAQMIRVAATARTEASGGAIEEAAGGYGRGDDKFARTGSLTRGERTRGESRVPTR